MVVELVVLADARCLVLPFGFGLRLNRLRLSSFLPLEILVAGVVVLKVAVKQRYFLVEH